MNRYQKLFKAIVVMGASLGTSACGDDDCGRCVPVDARAPDGVVADASPHDAGVDAPDPPADAPVDMVLIL